MGEKQFYSKAETRARLQIGRTRYAYLIESNILPKPIVLASGARPVHTDAQIQIAEQKIYRQATQDLQPVGRSKMKPLSAKLITEIKY